MKLVWIAIALAAASPRDVRADGPGYSIGARPVWFVTGGGTGGSRVSSPRGAFVGGELGLARIVEQHLAGVYADAAYDFGAGAPLVTFGPEVGWIRRSRTFPFALGVDGGAAVRFGDDRAVGPAGRVFVVLLGSFAVYGRYLYLDGDHVAQVGMSLKFPLAPAFGPGTR